MIKKLLKKFFIEYLPVYFPGECRNLVFAVWSAPTEPAMLWERFRALRVTIRSYRTDRERILLVLKKGEI